MANVDFKYFAEVMRREIDRREPATELERGWAAMMVLSWMCGVAGNQGETEFVEQAERLMPWLREGDE